MKHVLSWAIAFWHNLRQSLQMQRWLPLVLVAFLLLAALGDPGQRQPGLTETIQDQIHQNQDQRPKTTREWYEEAQETEGAPGKRLQRIGQESAEALGEFGSGYVKGTKQTAGQMGDAAARAGQDFKGQNQR